MFTISSFGISLLSDIELQRQLKRGWIIYYFFEVELYGKNDAAKVGKTNLYIHNYYFVIYPRTIKLY